MYTRRRTKSTNDTVLNSNGIKSVPRAMHNLSYRSDVSIFPMSKILLQFIITWKYDGENEQDFHYFVQKVNNDHFKLTKAEAMIDYELTEEVAGIPEEDFIYMNGIIQGIFKELDETNEIQQPEMFDIYRSDRIGSLFDALKYISLGQPDKAIVGVVIHSESDDEIVQVMREVLSILPGDYINPYFAEVVLESPMWISLDTLQQGIDVVQFVRNNYDRDKVVAVVWFNGEHQYESV